MAKKPIQQIKTGHKIALYIRVSTEEQAENPEGSIKSQEQRLRNHVHFRNMDGNFGEVVAVYIDRAKSGKDTNRSELQKMLAAIRRKEITLVMVTELSRLSRSIKDFCEIWEMMRANDCEFQSMREQFDTTTAAGEMVLYSIANIAQFERRQVSERVTANLNARSARGLYNGGPVPVGYKLIADKAGYLAVDDEQAKIVRMAFAEFLKKKSLTEAAKSLNRLGLRIKRQTQGGGRSSRLGHFTFGNLHKILTSKAYIGIRTYQTKAGVQEVRAVWEPIINEDTFKEVQLLLKKNHSRTKLSYPNRYPFLTAYITTCATCGDHLTGKSAHGLGGKIPYYEHGWSTKRQGCLVKKVFDCNPNRVLAKKLEPAVWEQVERLLANPIFAEDLIAEAQSLHQKKTQNSEIKRIKERIQGINSHLEALAERLAQLPKSVSAAHIFKTMEKLEAQKIEETARINDLGGENGTIEQPVALSSYREFLCGLNKLAQDPKAGPDRAKVVQSLIHKVEIKPDGFRLHFYVGENHFYRELASASSPFSGEGSGQAKIFRFPCSKSLTNGGNNRDRTCDLRLVRAPLSQLSYVPT